MKQILTTKLKLITSTEDNILLLEVIKSYVKGLNLASKVAFNNHKTTNSAIIHNNIYQNLRNDLGLPSQLSSSICRYVGATYKTLHNRNKNHIKKFKEKQQRNPNKKYIFKPYKGLEQPANFKSLTLTYQYKYDYTFKNNQQVSLNTKQGRILLSYQGYDKHISYIQDKNTKIGASKLCYNKVSKCFYLYVSFEVDIKDKEPEYYSNIVGVDVGQRYLAVTTNTKNKTKFYSGKEAIQKSNHYASKIKEIKSKGTPSAKRKLISYSGRERQFKKTLNHQISKEITSTYQDAIIGLEDLTNIRERTNRKSNKKASKKQKKDNKNRSKWSFRELQEMIAYKSNLSGSMSVKIDAHYTSQSCVKCGYVSKENRPNSGLMFICKSCNFKLHSDLVGARNICLRTLVARQDLVTKGLLSKTLIESDSSDSNVSDIEIKADIFKKYSEMRWSPETKVDNLIESNQ